MNKKQRFELIMDKIKQQKTISVNALASEFGITTRSIRRDLNEMSTTQNIEKFYGGAKMCPRNNSSYFRGQHIRGNREMTIGKMTLPDSDRVNGRVFILGSFNTDLVYHITNFPQQGETIKALNCFCSPGGKGSNQAVAAAMALADTHLMVKIGCDEFGEKAKAYFKSTAINTISFFESKKYPTGSAIVMIAEEKGDNAIIIDLAANQDFFDEEIASALPFIDRADIFLTQLENNFDAIATAVKFAHQVNTLTILNPAPYSDRVKEIAAFINIITPNKTEAESLSGIGIIDEASTRQAAEAIHRMGVGEVIITLGAEGCWHYNGQEHNHFEACLAVNVDTSGAGDAFNGALAAALAKRKPMAAAIEYASAFASLAIERKGASNMPEDGLVQLRIDGKL